MDIILKTEIDLTGRGQVKHTVTSEQQTLRGLSTFKVCLHF